MKNKIKLLIFDVDGTLTDGKIYMSDTGEAFKAFNIKDGYAVRNLLPKMNIIPVVITARQSKIVENRCAELDIMYCFQNCLNKVKKLHELAREFNINTNENGIYTDIAYMGDDIPDLECMKLCGLIGCPTDAVKEVKAIADFISTKKGGDGAAREFVEWLINN